MVFPIYVDLVCKHTGRNSLFQAKGAGPVQWNILVEPDYQFSCSNINPHAQQFQAQLYHDDVYVCIYIVRALVRFLPDGFSGLVPRGDTHGII